MVQDNLKFTDQAAVGLSFACLVHCLVLPFAIVLAPWLIPTFLADEVIHIGMLALALPISAFGMFLGFRMHREWWLVLLAFIGLAAMSAGVLQEAAWLERLLTVVGVSLLAFAHTMNWLARKRI